MITSSESSENLDLFVTGGGINFLNEILNPEQQKEIIIEILWTLSNISAGTEQQIRALLNDAELVQKLFNLMEHPIYTIRREAILVITNLISTT